MIQLMRLKNALTRIRTILFEASDPVGGEEAAAEARLAEIHAICWDAYCLSRCLKQNQLSLLVAQSYATVCSAQEVDEHSPSLARACIQSIDAQLNQVIRELDGRSEETSSTGWQETSSRGHHHEYFDGKRIAFHAETLSVLISWELSVTSIGNKQKVTIQTSEPLNFLYEPISIATFLTRLILIIPASRQKAFEINVEIRGLSVVFEMPLTKSSIVDVLIDPFSHLYFLARLAESSGISLVIDERGMRLVIPLQMPDRLLLNVDYGALTTIVDLSGATECCAGE